MKTETTHTHTQGPWQIHAAYFFGHDSLEIRGTNGDSSPFLCRLTDDTPDYEANARLIAAAPNLLQVARDFLLLAALHDWEGAAIDFAKATLSKVEGNA